MKLPTYTAAFCCVPTGAAMAPLQQLELWVLGNNVHNTERDECCPDFACCRSDGHWPVELRRKFMDTYMAGGAEAVEPMLMMGLQSLLVGIEVKTYLASEVPAVM